MGGDSESRQRLSLKECFKGETYVAWIFCLFVSHYFGDNRRVFFWGKLHVWNSRQNRQVRAAPKGFSLVRAFNMPPFGEWLWGRGLTLILVLNKVAWKVNEASKSFHPLWPSKSPVSPNKGTSPHFRKWLLADVKVMFFPCFWDSPALLGHKCLPAPASWSGLTLPQFPGWSLHWSLAVNSAIPESAVSGSRWLPFLSTSEVFSVPFHSKFPCSAHGPAPPNKGEVGGGGVAPEPRPSLQKLLCFPGVPSLHICLCSSFLPIHKSPSQLPPPSRTHLPPSLSFPIVFWTSAMTSHSFMHRRDMVSW